MTKCLLSLIILLAYFDGFCQHLISLGNPIATIELESLDLVSFDNKGQLFATTKSGDIHQFGKDGKSINQYSPVRQGKLDQLEAAWTVTIFGFSSDLQEYRIFDRFLNPIAENRFSSAGIDLAKAATLGNNNVIWAWDESDLSLKQVDYLRNLVIQSQPMNLILNSNDLDVLEIREFKNRLFLNAPGSGVFIFDNQANLIRTLAVKKNQKMCFYNEHLLWIEGEGIQIQSIVSSEVVRSISLPVSHADYLQVSQENLAVISRNRITLFALPEWLKKIR